MGKYNINIISGNKIDITENTIYVRSREPWFYISLVFLAFSFVMSWIYYYSDEFEVLSFSIMLLLGVPGIFLLGISQSISIDKQICYARNLHIWGFTYVASECTAPPDTVPKILIFTDEIRSPGCLLPVEIILVKIAFRPHFSYQPMGANFYTVAEAEEFTEKIKGFYGGDIEVVRSLLD